MRRDNKQMVMLRV